VSALTKLTLCLFAVGLASACNESATEPPRSGAVIQLATSGGFAGVDFEFSIDGPAGVVRGVRCVSFCDWEDGDILATVSAERIAELERKFDAANFLAGEDEDFGDECCDQFRYELNLTRREASRSIAGTSERLPPSLMALVRDIEVWVAEAREDGDA